MDRTFDYREALFFGALFHDIGKFQRIAEGKGAAHPVFSADWVEHLFENEIVTNAARYHHQKDLKESGLTGINRVIATLVCEADNLASGEREQRDFKVYQPKRQEIIFNGVQFDATKERTKYYQPYSRLNPFGKLYDFPNTDRTIVNKAIWNSHCQEFKKETELEASQQCNPNTFIYLFKKYLWSVPAAYYMSRRDISLFEHSRLTAAIASCMYDYLTQEGTWIDDVDFEKLTDKEARRFRLVCADLSGIQGFIYNIAHDGALKALKGRSFFIQQLLDSVAADILDQLDLSIANQVYCGGGKFYLLLPNTPKTSQVLIDVEKDINRKLLDYYHGQTSLVFASIEMCGADFQRKKIHQKWAALEDRLTKQKKHRPFVSIIDEAFFEDNHAPYGHVKLCYATSLDLVETKAIPKESNQTKLKDSYKEYYIQQGKSIFKIIDSDEQFISQEQYEAIILGQNLKKARPFLVHPLNNEPKSFEWTNQTKHHSILNIDSLSVKSSLFQAPKAFLLNNDDFLYLEKGKNKRLNTVAQKGFKFYGGDWIVDTETRKDAETGAVLSTFEYWERRTTGIRRLAVLRMDVDNLGKIFRSGFLEEGKTNQERKRVLTFSRLVQLSAMMDFFFSGYLNHLKELYWDNKTQSIIEQPNEGDENSQSLKDLIQIVYAGGDDVFLVGCWNMIPAVAVWIHDKFKKYVGCNEDITISAGIALFHGKQPLFKIANLAGEAEEQAKHYKRNEKEKNAISFLNNPVSWDDFKVIHNLALEWYRLIKEGTIDQQNKKAKLHRGFVRTIQDIYLEYVNYKVLLKRKDASKSAATITAEAQYGPWRWRAAYRLSRQARQYGAFRDHIEEIKENLFTNGRSSKKTEKDYLYIIKTAAQWADYLTRTENE